MPPLPPVFGTHEIADYYGVTKQLVYKWSRRSDFPPPVAGPDHPTRPLAMGSLWTADAVKRWGRKHGRAKGSGPRSAS